MFDCMDAPPRGALMLVYFTAAALISLSLLEFGLYLAECHKDQVSVGVVHASLLIVPCVLGVAILVRGRAVAEWISNKFDE
jgi:hypothetical protein